MRPRSSSFSARGGPISASARARGAQERRSGMSRRSVSSWLSPGPRVPIGPPQRRDFQAPHPAQPRPQKYSSCANSTCRRALLGSRVAGEDVEDQFGAVEHLGRRGLLARLRSWPGGQFVLEQGEVRASLLEQQPASSAALPLPMSVAGSGRSRRCWNVPTTVAPAETGQTAPTRRATPEDPTRRARAAAIRRAPPFLEPSLGTLCVLTVSPPAS